MVDPNVCDLHRYRQVVSLQPNVLTAACCHACVPVANVSGCLSLFL